jgi:hypothetical protein
VGIAIWGLGLILDGAVSGRFVAGATVVVVGFIRLIFFVVKDLFRNFEQAFAACFLLCCKDKQYFRKLRQDCRKLNLKKC